MTHNPFNHWLTVNECAALYQRNPSTILRWCRNGTFSYFSSQVLQIRSGPCRSYYIRQTLPIFEPIPSSSKRNL